MRISLPAAIFLLFCTLTQGFAQEANPSPQVQTIRKEIYTRVLNLNTDEASRFWPVFNEMQAKLNEINKKTRIERQNISQNYNTLTDAQMERALDNMQDLQQQSLDIQKKYYQKFKKVIPIKKVALMPKAKREFEKELLKIIQGYKDTEE